VSLVENFGNIVFLSPHVQYLTFIEPHDLDIVVSEVGFG